MKTRIKRNNLESLAAVRERERESISLFNVEFAYSINTFRKINKVKINKVKINNKTKGRLCLYVA